MAGGAKRSAGKAKAKAGAAAKGQASARAAKAPSASSSAPPPKKQRTADQAAATATNANARRRLGRRDSDEMTDRAVQYRLGHIPAALWEPLRNAEGLSIREVTKSELRQHKGESVRLSTRFWVRVFDEFKLSESMAMALPQPSVNEKIDANLVEALGVLHHDNPVARSSKPLEQMLEFTPELNRLSLCGLLRGVMEGPTVPRSTAMRCQVSVLKYIVRLDVASKHPDLVDPMRPLLDSALRWCWEDLASRGVSQTAFLAGHGVLLKVFVSEADLAAILACGQSYDKVAAQVHRVTSTSLTGKSVFKPARLLASRAIFREEIDERLKELEDQGFIEAEVASFKELMTRSTANLQDIGHKIYKKTEGSLMFLEQSVPFCFESVQDEWNVRLASRARSVALNAGDLEPLPWERALFRVGSLVHAPRFVNVPKSLLASNMLPARQPPDFCRRLFLSVAGP